MGLQDVKNEIVEEAEARAEVIVEEAEAQKEELLSEAKEQAEDLVQEAEEEAEQESEAIRRKKLSAARMQARKKKLQARESILDEAFDTFKERILNLDTEKEQELIENALKRLDDDIDIGTVYAAEKHEDVATQYGDFEAKDIHGVIVETADGSRRFDMQFEEVADRVIEDNRRAVSEVLFE